MSKTLLKVLALGLTLYVMSACTTLADVREARGQGQSREFRASFDTVWDRVPLAMNDVDLSVSGQSKDEGYFLGERGATAFSWGERVAVFVESLSTDRTLVEVVSRRRLATNVTAKNFEQALLDAIAARLK